MSTLASAELPSDEEADIDFVPTRPTKKRKIASKKAKSSSGSDSGSSSGSSEDEGDGGATEEAGKLKAEEAEQRRRNAAEAFAAFKDGPPPAVPGKAEPGGTKEMVLVRRQRKFAGETVSETVSLPRDHPEAVAYLGSGADPHDTSTAVPKIGPSEASADPTTTLSPAESASASTHPPTTLSGLSRKPLPKGPPKRKPRQSLEQLSAGLSGGKKMTTLEKVKPSASALPLVLISQSQMDWKSHIASSSNVADELEANRRSGGFLEKRDFLDRVGDRRSETLDKKRQTGK